MAHEQKPDFVFRRNGRVHLNRRGRQFSRLLAAEVCASAVEMPDTQCSEVVWRVLANHSIHQFPLHFLSYASPCAITFQLESTSSKQSICTTFWKEFLRSRDHRDLHPIPHSCPTRRSADLVKGKLANGVVSQYPSHYLGIWCIQHYYRWCAHLGCQ
jgi:hypothetical protein